MNYRIFRLGTREPMDELELHVLAKAYYAAWQCVHGRVPVREHIMPRLGLLIDFSPPKPVENGASPAKR
jgi:hypothetical protein